MSDNDYDLDFLEYELSDAYQGERIAANKEAYFKDKKEQAHYMVNSLSLSEIVEYAQEKLNHPNYIPDQYTKTVKSILDQYRQTSQLTLKQRYALALHYQLKKVEPVVESPKQTPKKNWWTKLKHSVMGR